MRLLLRLRRRPMTVILAFMVLLAAALAVRNLGLVSVPVLPPTVVCRKDFLTDHSPPTNMLYGAHNFRQPNRVITEYDDVVAARLATLVKRRSTAADPDLIRLIVDMLDPPSTHMVKMSRQLFSTPQSREVDKILRQKVG